jgi:hypothetical protein
MTVFPLVIYIREIRPASATAAPTHLAQTTVDGVNYEAKSRTSSVFQLCRDLLAGGLQDGPFQVVWKATGTIGYSGPSWKFLAGLTVSEPEARGPVIKRHEQMPAQLCGRGNLKDLKCDSPNDGANTVQAPSVVPATTLPPWCDEAASESTPARQNVRKPSTPQRTLTASEEATRLKVIEMAKLRPAVAGYRQ